MQRALSILLALAVAGPALAEEWRMELFLGGNHQGTLNWGGTDREIDQGGVGGIAFLRSNPDTRLEFGVELTHAENRWVGFPGEEQRATSLMAVGEYTFSQGERIDGYAGVGLGVVRVGYQDGTSSESDETIGGQVVIGARYKIPASTYQAFVEYRYMDTFDDATLPSGNDVEYSRQDLVLGIRLGF